MRLTTMHRAAIGATVAALLTLSPAASATQESGSIQLDGKSLGDLIQMVSTATGKRFIYQERVKGVKVYGQIPSAAKPETLRKYFHSILELNGFAIASIGEGTNHEVHKIVDARNMRRYATPTYTAAEIAKNPNLLGDVDRVVTVIVHLQHASAREVSNSLRPLLDPNVGGQIIGIDKVEAIIMTDYASNMRKLLRAIQEADAPRTAGQMEHDVFPLRHARAVDVATMIRTRLRGPVARQVHVITLDAAGGNGLAVMAPGPALQFIRKWIANVDVDPAKAKGGK